MCRLLGRADKSPRVGHVEPGIPCTCRHIPPTMSYGCAGAAPAILYSMSPAHSQLTHRAVPHRTAATHGCVTHGHSAAYSDNIIATNISILRLTVTSKCVGRAGPAAGKSTRALPSYICYLFLGLLAILTARSGEGEQEGECTSCKWLQLYESFCGAGEGAESRREEALPHMKDGEIIQRFPQTKAHSPRPLPPNLAPCADAFPSG